MIVNDEAKEGLDGAKDEDLAGQPLSDITWTSPNTPRTTIFILILASAVASILPAMLGRLDISLRTAYISVPLVCACVISLSVRSRTPKRSASKLLFFFTFFLVVLLQIMAYEFCRDDAGRTLPWFLVVGLSISVVFVQLTYLPLKTNLLVLAVTAEISLTLTLSVMSLTLNSSTYFGGTDVLFQFDFTDSVLHSGRLTEQMGFYQSFPLYHLLLASLAGMGDFSGIGGEFFMTGVIAGILPFISYIALGGWLDSRRLRLLAVLFLTLNPVSLYYSAYFLPRSLAFMLFLILIGLISRGKWKASTTMVYVVVSFSIVACHSQTAFDVAIILLVMYGIILFNQRGVADRRFTCRLRSLVSIYLAITISYFLFAASEFTRSTVRGTLFGISAQEVFSGPVEIIHSYSGAVTFLVNQMAMVGLILFASLGFLTSRQSPRSSSGYYSTTFGLVCLAFFLDVPLAVFPQTNSVFMVARISLIVVPFVAPLVGIGMARLLYAETRPGLAALRIPIVVLVALSTVLVIIAPDVTNDNGVLRSFYSHDRTLFLSSEIQSFVWVSSHAQNISSSSDYYVSRYPWANFTIANQSAPWNGDLLLLRESALEESHLLLAGPGGYVGYYQELPTYGPINAGKIDSWKQRVDIVLDEGSSVASVNWADIGLPR